MATHGRARRRRPHRELLFLSIAVALLAAPLASAAPAPAPPSLSALSPEQIFKETAPAVVFITEVDDTGKTLFLGSGFIVSPSGVIVTNAHMVKPAPGAAHLHVQLTRGDTFTDVRVIFVDERRDLAVIFIVATGLPTVRIGDSDKLEPGNRVYIIGNPGGLRLSMTEGIVESIRMDPRGFLFIQHQVATSGGSSGAPLLNARGEVVGVHAFGLTDLKNTFNGAIPINYAKPYFTKEARMTWEEWAATAATAPARPTPAPQPTPTPGPAPVSAACGTWHSNYGDITLQCGQSTSGGLWFLTGYWDQAAGKRGIIKGGTFNPATGVVQFDYYQSWNKVNGSATFTLESNGTRMEGHWSQSNGDSGSWSAWR